MYCNFVGHRATFSGRDFLEERGAKKPLSKETFNLAVLLYCIHSQTTFETATSYSTLLLILLLQTLEKEHLCPSPLQPPHWSKIQRVEVAASSNRFLQTFIRTLTEPATLTSISSHY